MEKIRDYHGNIRRMLEGILYFYIVAEHCENAMIYGGAESVEITNQEVLREMSRRGYKRSNFGVAVIIDSLEKAGLIRTREDRNEIKIRITPKGMVFAKQLRDFLRLFLGKEGF